MKADLWGYRYRTLSLKCSISSLDNLRAGTPLHVSPSPTRLPGIRTEWAGYDSSVCTDMDVTHYCCGKSYGCPRAYDYWRNDKIAMATIVGKDSYAATNGRIVTYSYVLRV